MARMAAGICTVHSFFPWEGSAKCRQGNQSLAWPEEWLELLRQGHQKGAPAMGERETCTEGPGAVLAGRPHLVGEAMQAVLGAAHHQDLVYPDKPHRLGTQLDAVLGALGVSVE